MNVLDNLSEVLHEIDSDNTSFLGQSALDMAYVLQQNGYSSIRARVVADRINTLVSSSHTLPNPGMYPYELDYRIRNAKKNRSSNKRPVS